MGSSVKDAHLHIENEDKTEKPIWSASFAFGAVRRSTVVDEVCRCHARPAERSGLLARSPREIRLNLLVSPIHSERADLT